MKIFGLSRILTLSIFALSIAFIIGMAWRIFINESGETHYIVTSPNGDNHLTTYILEKHGCAIFIDELGIQNRVCGSYTIKKL